MNRYKLFRIAREFTGLDVDYFAEKYHCSVQNIYGILQGKHRSRIIEREIDEYILDTLQTAVNILDSLKKAA